MSSDEDDLGEAEAEASDEEGTEELVAWQRGALRSASYDLSLATLRNQWREGDLKLPELPRARRWAPRSQSRLVESLLLGIPVPALYFTEDAEGRWNVIDGQQRLRAVLEYLDGEFALDDLELLPELGGRRFADLDVRWKRTLLTSSLRANVLLADSDPDMRFEVFLRLNSGATALNEHEVREALYPGPAVDLLRELAQHPVFRELLGRAPDSRGADSELVLRFFALRELAVHYQPPLGLFLNHWLGSEQHAATVRLDELRSLFDVAMRRVQALFGHRAFRLLKPDGAIASPRASRAVFDAQAVVLSFADAAPAELAARSEAAIAAFADLCADVQFVYTVRTATTSRAAVLTRISATATAVRQVGVAIELPL